MKLVVGLGNPGDEYKNTRHNTGFFVLDALEAKFSIFPPKADRPMVDNFQFSKKFNTDILQIGDLVLAKPVTFMNQSGGAVKTLARHFLLDANQLDARRLYVIHDDLDIKLGDYKIQLGRGPKEHRGVTSVEMALGSKDFWRVRIGVDNRQATSDKRQVTSGDEYVLSNFPKEEKKVIDRVINKITTELVRLLDKKTEDLTN